MAIAKFSKKRKDDVGTLIFMFKDSVFGQYRFLSNFEACDVTLPAETVEIGENHTLHLPPMKFDNVENAYMAWKTLDLGLRAKIAQMSPKEAKRLSLDGEIPLRPDYSDEGRLFVMTLLNEQKYSRNNPELRKKLLETEDACLMEGNTWGDTFFGFDLNTGHGENNLGQILMYVRDKIRTEEGLDQVAKKTFDKVSARQLKFPSKFKM
tara:strand:- start:906 stop:1529 length:624 start_codon:yes stop_codon:yes gene_type:complete